MKRPGTTWEIVRLRFYVGQLAVLFEKFIRSLDAGKTLLLPGAGIVGFQMWSLPNVVEKDEKCAPSRQFFRIFFINTVSFCSLHQAPSYGPNFTLIAPVPAKIAYSSISIILDLVCIACRAGELINEQHGLISQLVESQSSKQTSHSHNRAWVADPNGIFYLPISQ